MFTNFVAWSYDQELWIDMLVRFWEQHVVFADLAFTLFAIGIAVGLFIIVQRTFVDVFFLLLRFIRAAKSVMLRSVRMDRNSRNRMHLCGRSRRRCVWRR